MSYPTPCRAINCGAAKCPTRCQHLPELKRWQSRQKPQEIRDGHGTAHKSTFQHAATQKELAFAGVVDLSKRSTQTGADLFAVT